MSPRIPELPEMPAGRCAVSCVRGFRRSEAPEAHPLTVDLDSRPPGYPPSVCTVVDALGVTGVPVGLSVVAILSMCPGTQIAPSVVRPVPVDVVYLPHWLLARL